MKTHILLLTVLLLTSGCVGDSGLCRNDVAMEMNTSDVTQAPGRNYGFIARTKDGAVWYVETLGADNKITYKSLIFPPLK